MTGRPYDFGVLVGVLFVAGCSSAPAPRSQSSPLLRSVLPQFQAQTANGGELDTNAFQGRPLVISFFSHECARCEGTLRAAQSTYSDMHEVTVVGVFRGDQRAALQLANQYDLRFPLALDEEQAIAQRFAIDELPTTFVADGRGWVSWVAGADMTADGLKSAIRTVQ